MWTSEREPSLPSTPLCTIFTAISLRFFSFPMMHLAIVSTGKPDSREWGHYPHTKGHLEKELLSQFKLWLPEPRPIRKKRLAV